MYQSFYRFVKTIQNRLCIYVLLTLSVILLCQFCYYRYNII